MDDFHLTRMGARHYEKTMPGILNELKKANDNLQLIADMLTLKTGLELDMDIISLINKPSNKEDDNA